MKVMRLYVTPELITTMLTTGYELGPGLKVGIGIPDGSVLTAIGWDAAVRSYAFDFFNPYWSDVPEGQVPPLLGVLSRRRALCCPTD